MYLKINFVLKSKRKNIDKEYKYKLKNFENESIRIKEEIKSLRKENEKLIEQKEYFEGQINNELNNINNNENILNNNDLIEEKGNEEEEIESCKNLENLIMNCKENETKEAPEENKEENIEINNIDKKTENQITINKKDNNILENKISGGSINNNIKSSSLKTKSIRIKTNEHNSKEINLKKSVNFNELKTKKSDDINSAYNIMFKGRHFQYPTRIASKDYRDYFKQFFFLLFQSMKMNSDNNIEIFLGKNPEILYKQCKKEHIPFQKYQKWIEKKLLRIDLNNNYKKYEDFSTITGILCSSFI